MRDAHNRWLRGYASRSRLNGTPCYISICGRKIAGDVRIEKNRLFDSIRWPRTILASSGTFSVDCSENIAVFLFLADTIKRCMPILVAASLSEARMYSVDAAVLLNAFLSQQNHVLILFPPFAPPCSAKDLLAALLSAQIQPDIRQEVFQILESRHRCSLRWQ